MSKFHFSEFFENFEAQNKHTEKRSRKILYNESGGKFSQISESEIIFSIARLVLSISVDL